MSKESYMRGFEKVAAAAGIAPADLLKYAQFNMSSAGAAQPGFSGMVFDPSSGRYRTIAGLYRANRADAAKYGVKFRDVAALRNNPGAWKLLRGGVRDGRFPGFRQAGTSQGSAAPKPSPAPGAPQEAAQASKPIKSTSWRQELSSGPNLSSGIFSSAPVNR
jgi:hypothetical protein